MLRSLVGSEMCIRDSPYHALLNQPLNYNQQSSVSQQLNFSRRILQEAEANLHKQFLSSKAEFDKSAKSQHFPIGCKLFVRTSQRGKIAFKLAHTWKGPYVCLEHLQHNNLLIKPLNGRKTEKVHKNLCKLAPFRDQHLRLSEDFSILFPNYPPPNISKSRSPGRP